jgi:hypothetical protein
VTNNYQSGVLDSTPLHAPALPATVSVALEETAADMPAWTVTVAPRTIAQRRVTAHVG